MKGYVLAAMLVGLVVGPSVPIGTHCVGALQAMAAQERSTPPGEWCQRPTSRMSPKAHACECHKHDCTKDPDDPDNLSAHTDAKCLNYCTTANCQCAVMDCK